jgi:hypothetical protein
MQTTFGAIKAKGPCHGRYSRAARIAGGVKKFGADTPITALQILEHSGLEDLLWCWSLFDQVKADRIGRIFACDCADHVRHLMKDYRSTNAIDVARRFANGEVTREELAAAWAAATGAARAAATGAARAAATDAARAAVTAAATGAARAAATDAARAAVTAAATGAARDAATAAATDAARAAVTDAARAAATDAARAAAWAAARDAEREWQTAHMAELLQEAHRPQE